MVLEMSSFPGSLISDFRSNRKTGTPDTLPDHEKMVVGVSTQIDKICVALLSDLRSSGRTKLRNGVEVSTINIRLNVVAHPDQTHTEPCRHCS